MEIDFRSFDPDQLQTIAETAYEKIGSEDLNAQPSMEIMRMYRRLHTFANLKTVTPNDIQQAQEACDVLSSIVPYAFENIATYLGR